MIDTKTIKIILDPIESFYETASISHYLEVNNELKAKFLEGAAQRGYHIKYIAETMHSADQAIEFIAKLKDNYDKYRDLVTDQYSVLCP